ncbi:MAG TPA: FAD-dependent oxidoreductase [Steroidobacteraceae bacterium]|nr:FAD-dependent oxidoreductase [Steroidobacteraceae bacterium]
MAGERRRTATQRREGVLVKIAVIGSGIAGNVAAYHLCREHEITVFEAADHVGGHTHTHEIEFEGRQIAVDTGFIVCNDRTYPQFLALMAELGVELQPGEMSFSVQAANGLEYNGTSLNSLFAQRRNLLRPSFWRMIRDILRFNREAPRLLGSPDNGLSMGEYLDQNAYSREFLDHYILPMGAAIWSAGTGTLRTFPARYFVRFFHNHGMLTVDDRPQWRTVRGGSARYVDKLTAGFRDRIRLRTPVEGVRRGAAGVFIKAASSEPERFDRVFFACHSDQALHLLTDASETEREVLGAIRYQRNDVLLHSDVGVLPRSRLAWAAWNYHLLDSAAERVAVTYHMGLLQKLDTRTPLLVTLNMADRVDERRVIRRMSYEHPVFTAAAVAAQARQAEINGANRAYFCGAYWRFGFHEDGVVSALNALSHFRNIEHAQRPVHRTA